MTKTKISVYAVSRVAFFASAMASFALVTSSVEASPSVSLLASFRTLAVVMIDKSEDSPAAPPTLLVRP